MQHAPSRNVDPHADRPEYRQIADQLAVAIETGKYKADTRLPSEAALVRDYGVSRLTVRRAFGVLDNQGLIYKVKGKGSFVRSRQPLATMRSANRFRAKQSPLVVDVGERAIQEVYDVREIPAPEDVADTLGIGEGDDVFVRRRTVQLEDDTPMQLADSYVPLDLVTDQLRDREAQGVTYSSIESHGLHIGLLREYLDVRMPTDDERRDLRLESGSPVVQLTRVAYANSGGRTWDDLRESAEEYIERSRPVEVFKSIMAGPRHRFVYDLPR